MFDQIKWDDRGLIPAIVQDAETQQVLMMAYMSVESLRLTRETGETVFWSRSRNELWHKGATSGNVQRVEHIYVDCDGDTLLILVSPAGPACHTGAISCFFQELTDDEKVRER
jgi:phosphoribosyl-AMP cyclohydrolase